MEDPPLILQNPLLKTTQFFDMHFHISASFDQRTGFGFWDGGERIKKFRMYLNRFDDDQRGFGSFTDWLFICESDIELVKFGFQNVRH